MQQPRHKKFPPFAAVLRHARLDPPNSPSPYTLQQHLEEESTGSCSNSSSYCQAPSATSTACSTVIMAGTGGDATLYEETFTIDEYNQSKYDRVARIFGKSNDRQTTMSLDVNIELFPCAQGESLEIVLATSLALDGSKDDEKGWRDVGKGDAIGGEGSLADMYDYVCHGSIYKFEDGADGQTM